MKINPSPFFCRVLNPHRKRNHQTYTSSCGVLRRCWIKSTLGKFSTLNFQLSIQKGFIHTPFLQKNGAGFTLIELLIVITILGILAAGVLVAIDPGEKIKQTNDTKVQIDVSAIGRAAEAYAIQQGGSYPASASELATYGELRKLPNPPSSAYGTSYTYTALPANCTTAAKDCTSITVTSPLLSKKYSAAAANTPFWKYESTTGTSCAVADPTYSCSAPLPTPTLIPTLIPTPTPTPTPTLLPIFDFFRFF